LRREGNRCFNIKKKGRGTKRLYPFQNLEEKHLFLVPKKKGCDAEELQKKVVPYLLHEKKSCRGGD